MRGGEDLSRRRRSSSRGSFSGLSIQPAVLRSSNVGVAQPVAPGANAATAARAAEPRYSDNEPPTGSALQCEQPRPADLQGGTAVQSSEHSTTAEVRHSSLADHGSTSAAYCTPDSTSRHVPVAWQPGIDLLEGMQESTAQAGPTEARRLSDSAASGPRSYPLSPSSLAAVSPAPPVQLRDNCTAAATPPADTLPPAAAARVGLPAPTQISTSVLHSVAYTEPSGWTLPPRAPPAAAGVRADGKHDANSKVGAGSTVVRPLEQQLSNVDAAMPAAEPGEGRRSWCRCQEHAVLSKAFASMLMVCPWATLPDALTLCAQQELLPALPRALRLRPRSCYSERLRHWQSQRSIRRRARRCKLWQPLPHRCRTHG